MSGDIKSPVYRILAALLSYPEPQLCAALPEIRAAVAQSPDLDLAEIEVFLGVIDWMSTIPVLEWEALYVQTFDLNPDFDLHLTAHLCAEDDRSRGPALIRLATHYEAAGWTPLPTELPDYLPLVLEYAATLEEGAAREFLASAGEAIDLLNERLTQAVSPYAPLVRLTAQRGHDARRASIGEGCAL